ncbi:MAG: SsrA-binding protein SmpB [Clostridia bacterium]|nr:SsrA-binding protein SmpB [Clostridia bacterium]
MKVVTKNKRAYFDYFIEEEYKAGIVLVGSEVKSIRSGHMSLEQSFISVSNGEVFLKNAYIKTYEYANSFAVDEHRDRKLLLNKSEIQKIINKVKVKGYTIIPTKVFIENGLVKVSVALAKGKKNYDKKECIKQKDIKRAVEREIKAKFN